MTAQQPMALRRCTACDRDHYVPVRFCPFCGARQVEPAPQPVAPPPDAPPIDVPREPAASPEPPVAAPPPPPAAPARATPPTAPPAAAPVRTPHPVPRRPRRIRIRHGILALAAISGLAMLALARHAVVPAPARIEIGPAWTALALKPFRSAALLRLTADSAFSLRLDGGPVQRITPSSGATVRLKLLRSLELRAGRGPVTVTLTPKGG